MGKKLKLFLGISYLIILTGFLYFLFLSLEINRLDDFSYYKELQLTIEEFIGTNYLLNLIYFFIFSIIWIILLGFGSPLLLISGIFFGKWVGFSISLISISIGTLLLYIIANFFFKDLVKNYLEKKFERYILVFKKNEFLYFFAYRFLGGLGIPFGLQNTLPVLFNMRKINYFFASFFGFIPSMFIMNTIGAGLNSYIEQAQKFSLFDLILSSEIYSPMLMFVGLMVSSLLIKKKFFDDPS